MNDRTPKRQDRINKRQISAFVDLDVYRSFKILAAEQCATTDGMVAKAVSLLFEHYKKEVPVALQRRLKSLGLSLIALWCTSSIINA